MTRFGSIILCATSATGLLACGGGGTSTKNILDLVPVDNTVSGWTVDTSSNKNGKAQPMTATTHQEAESLIDGAAAPFYKAPFTPSEFLWQNYVNNSLPAAPQGAYLLLYILQMPSADQASACRSACRRKSPLSLRVKVKLPNLPVARAF